MNFPTCIMHELQLSCPLDTCSIRRSPEIRTGSLGTKGMYTPRSLKSDLSWLTVELYLSVYTYGIAWYRWDSTGTQFQQNLALADYIFQPTLFVPV